MTPLATAEPITQQETLLKVHDLSVWLGTGIARTQVLHDVDLTVPSGQTVGLVGESGSGKSTLAKTIMGIHQASTGSIDFQGENIIGLRGRHQRALWRDIQMIPQDPYSSLDPRRTVGETIAEAIDPKRASVRRLRTEIQRWLDVVALDADAMDRYPHEFSGGQRQRIAIARALSVEPALVIADEITSALDLTTQAEILNLLSDLKKRLQLTMVFISHNLAVVRHVSDQVAVMLHGVMVESGSEQEIFENPTHEYTQKLMASVPGGPGFTLSAPTD